MSHILIVEDEQNIGLALQDSLKREGMKIFWAKSLSDARDVNEKQSIDLALLDWMLPDGQGIDLLREWRSQGIRFPVIMLTARNEVTDKVLGLEIGANDYIVKPFEPRELIARIRVQLRQQKQDGGEVNDGGVNVGDIKISRNQRRAWHGDREVNLTKVEFDLLLLLMENPGQVFTREELLNRVWGYNAYPTTRTVDTHILQLRQKFGNELFETIRGVGYRIRSKGSL